MKTSFVTEKKVCLEMSKKEAKRLYMFLASTSCSQDYATVKSYFDGDIKDSKVDKIVDTANETYKALQCVA